MYYASVLQLTGSCWLLCAVLLGGIIHVIASVEGQNVRGEVDAPSWIVVDWWVGWLLRDATMELLKAGAGAFPCFPRAASGP